MYVKLFSSLYQGTLRGQTHPIVVFTNLLAHCDRDGCVDVHWRVIADETGLTQDQVRAAIAYLEAPDPDSRTPDEDGRRLVKMDDHRDWGWRVVNYAKYRAIRSEEDRRDQNREAQARKRQRSQQSQPPSAHADADASGEAHGEGYAGRTRGARKRAEFVLPAWLHVNDWKPFVAHRSKLRKPMTDHAAELVVAKLDALRAKGYDHRDLINTAIERGWQTVFEPVALGPSKFAPPTGSVKSRERNDPQEGLKPDMSTDAWRRQMAAMGVDVDAIKTGGGGE